MKKIHFISKKKLKSRTTLMNKMLRIWLKFMRANFTFEINCKLYAELRRSHPVIIDMSIPESEVMLLRTIIRNNRNGE